MKTKLKYFITTIILVLLLSVGSANSQFLIDYWFPNSDDRLQPIDDSYGIYTAQDLDWDGELMPDGATCSNGEILKKTGADDWDCEADNNTTYTGGTNLTLNGTQFDVDDAFIKLVGDTTGALSEDLNIDANTLVVSYNDNKVWIGTASS
ncbi:hypothetical protein LCGC14_2397140, partial [marine sediment metagenome]